MLKNFWDIPKGHRRGVTQSHIWISMSKIGLCIWIIEIGIQMTLNLKVKCKVTRNSKGKSFWGNQDQRDGDPKSSDYKNFISRFKTRIFYSDVWSWPSNKLESIILKFCFYYILTKGVLITFLLFHYFYHIKTIPTLCCLYMSLSFYVTWHQTAQKTHGIKEV